jgi:hypothetical protein
VRCDRLLFAAGTATLLPAASETATKILTNRQFGKAIEENYRWAVA